MKRLFLILLFFGCACLFSCQQRYDILDYQRSDLVAECRINGKYTVEIAKCGQKSTVRVLEPENARDITFSVGEDVSLSVDELEVEMEREELGGICALAGIFSQKEEFLTSAVEKGDESVLTFQENDCIYQITLSKVSLPKRVYIVSDSFEYDVEILSIEIAEG